MSPRGIAVVSVWVAAMLVANVAFSDRSSIDWDATPVAAGFPVKVTVHAAACHPLTVILYVNGREITGQITEAPGSVVLDVPAGTQGMGYTIEIRCPDERVSQTGSVI